MIKTPQVMPPPDATATAPAPRAGHRIDATYPFRKGPVLLACNGWEQSDGSLIAARLIASRLGFPFEVVTVLEPLPIYGTDDSDGLSVLAELDLRPIREARVRHQVETWVPPGESWLLHVRYGSFTREISRSGPGASRQPRRSRLRSPQSAGDHRRRNPSGPVAADPGLSRALRRARIHGDSVPCRGGHRFRAAKHPRGRGDDAPCRRRRDADARSCCAVDRALAGGFRRTLWHALDRMLKRQCPSCGPPSPHALRRA